MSKSKSLKNRIISIGVAGTLIAGAVCGSMYFNAGTAYAKVTLRGIEDIVTEHSSENPEGEVKPFVIYEVVPELNDSSLGYLVGGEENIHDGKSIKDMPSKAERSYWLNDTANPEKFDPENSVPNAKAKEMLGELNASTGEYEGGAYAFSEYVEPSALETGYRSMDIRGTFSLTDPAGTGHYKPNDYSTAYELYTPDPYDEGIEALYGDGNTEGIVLYRHTDAFRLKDDYFTGGWSISIQRIGDFEMPSKTTGTAIGTGDAVYNWQYFISSLVTDTSQLSDGQIIFCAEKDAAGDYLDSFGVIRTDDDGNLKLYRYRTGGTSTPPLMAMARPRITPSPSPTVDPSASPSVTPSESPSVDPSASPSADPDTTPMPEPEDIPTPVPSEQPTPSTEPEVTPEPESPTPEPIPEPLPEPETTPDMNAGGGFVTGIWGLKNVMYKSPAYRYVANSDLLRYQMINNARYSSVYDLPPSSNPAIAIEDMVGDGRAYDYYIVEETNVAGPDSYRVSSVFEDTEAFLGRKLEYTKVSDEKYNSTNCSVSKAPYYVKVDDEDEYLYVQAGDADYEFTADYSETVYQTFKYEGGIKNEEWFKQYVFDREPGTECDNLYLDVIPVAADKLTIDMVDKADLIYFAGGRYFGDHDISAEAAIEVLDKVINEDKPVILERSSYYANATFDGTPLANNMMLLSLELMQGSLNIPTVDGQTSSETWQMIIDGDPAAPLTFSDLLDSMRYSTAQAENYDVSYVQGTVFVNDDWDDENETVISENKVVALDFNESYSQDKINGIGGFEEVRLEYASEKPIIETYGDWSQFNSSYSKATSIRYILNANNSRNIVKTSLKVLDLEPLQSNQYSESELLKDIYWNDSSMSWATNRFPLWDATGVRSRDIMTKDWILSNVVNASDSEKSKFKVDVTQMGTKEFIGINTDLNATYDMIYLGMDTLLMNTDNNGIWPTKGTTTTYNDTGMNGLVYTHMGDKVHYAPDWDGWNADVRFSGNDITFDKKRELTEYVKAGYAMVISDGFFNVDGNGAITGINTGRVDSSSYLYEFLNEVVMSKTDGSYNYLGKNIFRKGALENAYSGHEAAREVFSRYLNISKLSIEVLEQPLSYNYVDSNNTHQTRYLPMNSDGTYSMNFKVTLKNDAAVDAGNTSYDCKLYLDLDADGKFEEGEALSGLSISGADTDENGKFHLRAGNTYEISRLTPDEYVGFLSWKLAFIQNEKQTSGSNSDATSVRSAITGFSAVPANAAKKPTIKILQIIPNSGNTNFDLSNDAMDYLYNKVNDFNIEVYQKTVGTYLSKWDSQSKVPSDLWEYKYSYYDYLCKYDMVVMGFTDMYEFTTDLDWCYDRNLTQQYHGRNSIMHDGMLAIREYALSGHSVLFTHDMSSYHESSTQWGYLANTMLRDLEGMDRYGRLSSSNRDLKYNFDRPGVTVQNYDSKYDSARLKGNDTGENRGISDNTVLRFSGDKIYGLTTRQITSSYVTDASSTVPWSGKETITAINEGQITQYPFLITDGIGDSFEVKMTHAQYFQLNLDTDSQDSNANDDVVVWYAISNNSDSSDYRKPTLHEYYKAVHNDVRNNYYIYSKGNVIYTGCGHSAVDSDLEKKLFVNTLVASYSSGLHAPRVVFKANTWDSSATITNIYLPYDTEIINADGTTGEFLDNYSDGTTASNGGLTVCFKTLNNNFRDSNATLYTKYYIKGTNTAYDLFDGSNYYKEVTPNGYFKMIDDAGNRVDSSANSLINYKIYEAKFRISDLNLGNGHGVLPEDFGSIYVRIGTTPLSNGTFSALPATESIAELNINTTRLLDLE